MKNKLIYYIVAGGTFQFFGTLVVFIITFFVSLILLTLGIYYFVSLFGALISLFVLVVWLYMFYYNKEQWALTNMRQELRMQKYIDLVGKECLTVAVEEDKHNLFILYFTCENKNYSLGLGRGRPKLGRNSVCLLRSKKFKFSMDPDNNDFVVITPNTKNAYYPGKTYHKVLIGNTLRRLFVYV